MAATASAAEDQVRSIHQYKITPPTYDGDFSTFEEWKYKFTAYIGLINPIFPRLVTNTIRAITRPHHRPSHQSRSRHHRGRRKMDQVGIRASVHSSEHHQRSSSNCLSTDGPHIQWPRDMEAIGHQVFHPCWDQIHRLSHQAFEAII